MVPSSTIVDKASPLALQASDSSMSLSSPTEDNGSRSPTPEVASQHCKKRRQLSAEEVQDDEDEDQVANIQAQPSQKKKRKGEYLHCLGMLIDCRADPPPPAKTITYNLSIFSTAKMKKPKTKRSSKNKFIQLKSDQEWDTVQAQFLVQIDCVLHPRRIRIEDYDITFIVPRHSPNPVPLSEQKEYEFLLERALKAKDPVVNVTMVPSELDDDKVCRVNLFPSLN